MSVRCQVTGKKPGYGNQVSHSNRKTRRRWLPNVQNKRYWLAAENRWIRLRVSTKGMKTIEKRGIDAVVADMRARGERI
ncbi:50S ribosomal protein L28 [Saccharopolyspora sp. NPDC049426]|uniref:50S ribosomal protein L28 n=1 Tax=Saccharopolyspora sp. NPDC049426 TaxID=3155652 RepID=UPI003436A45C